MKKPKDLNLETLSLHAGNKPDSDFGSRATPIYQTSSFVFPDSETAAGIFNNERNSKFALRKLKNKFPNFLYFTAKSI